MHGVTRQITLPIQLLGEGPGPDGKPHAGFLTQTELKRSEFGMTKYLENNVGRRRHRHHRQLRRHQARRRRAAARKHRNRDGLHAGRMVGSRSGAIAHALRPDRRVLDRRRAVRGGRGRDVVCRRSRRDRPRPGPLSIAAASWSAWSPKTSASAGRSRSTNSSTRAPRSTGSRGSCSSRPRSTCSPPTHPAPSTAGSSRSLASSRSRYPCDCWPAASTSPAAGAGGKARRPRRLVALFAVLVAHPRLRPPESPATRPQRTAPRRRVRHLAHARRLRCDHPRRIGRRRGSHLLPRTAGAAWWTNSPTAPATQPARSP